MKSIELYNAQTDLLPAWLLDERQRMADTWHNQPPEIKARYGTCSTPRDNARTRPIMLFPSYRMLWVYDPPVHEKVVSMFDMFAGSMPHLPGDEEFFEEDGEFFEQFNSAGLRFGEVCYGYYLMTHPERQNEGCATTLICEAIGLAALWGFDSFVVDLAINPPLERAVRLFERQGFRPTAHLVHDEMGNEWRQYLLPLGGREVDLGDYGFVIGVK